MDIQYYLKYGEVETRTKPAPATMELVKAWYDEWSVDPALEDYQVYLVGSFAEREFGTYDGDVYDVDVVLVGEIKDALTLKGLLESALTLGFKHNIMIDVWRNSTLMDLRINKSIEQTRAYSTYYSKITIGEKVYEAAHQLWNGNGVSDAGLFTYTYSAENPARSWVKANQRILDGKYLGIQKNILTINT